MSAFNVDFFDFAYLVEMSMPPNTMTRVIFFRKVVDEYYYKMEPAEREHLYQYISRKDKYDLSNKEIAFFEARFNPENQYRVMAEVEGKAEFHFAFKLPNDDKYYIKSDTWVTPELIKSVEELWNTQ